MSLGNIFKRIPRLPSKLSFLFVYIKSGHHAGGKCPPIIPKPARETDCNAENTPTDFPWLKIEIWYEGGRRERSFLPYSAVIFGLWPWFSTIWKWFPIFLCEVITGKNTVEEIESIMGARGGSPLWACKGTFTRDVTSSATCCSATCCAAIALLHGRQLSRATTAYNPYIGSFWGRCSSKKTEATARDSMCRLIPQKSLAIARDFWNTNSLGWTPFHRGAHDGFSISIIT